MFLFPSSSVGSCGGRPIAFQKCQKVNSGQLRWLRLSKKLLISISKAHSETLPLDSWLRSSLLQNNSISTRMLIQNAKKFDQRGVDECRTSPLKVSKALPSSSVSLWGGFGLCC